MADKISNSSTIDILTEYVDADTRTIKLKNPKESQYITNQQITELETLILNGDGTKSLLIGDKEGSDFRRINKVVKTEKTILTLDLSGEE